jgi:DNA-binding response OmpR family regulator
LKGEDGPSILVIEHDPEIGGPIVEQLTADGYRSAFAHTAQHARALAVISPPALILLGHLDPSSGALELLAEIRNGDRPWQEHLPVIVLGSPARPIDLLRAFAAGADDYLARSAGWDQDGNGLDYLELRARLQSLLRRATFSIEPPLPRLCIGPLLIDTSSRAVELHDRPIRLRPREYALLLHLAQEPTRVFTKHDLLRALWGLQVPSYTRTLDSHACRLRGKLALVSTERWVINVRGVGYRLKA